MYTKQYISCVEKKIYTGKHSATEIRFPGSYHDNEIASTSQGSVEYDGKHLKLQREIDISYKDEGWAFRVGELALNQLAKVTRHQALLKTAVC